MGGNLPIFRKLPFLRGEGFTPRNRVRYAEVNLDAPEFSGTEVTPELLRKLVCSRAAIGRLRSWAAARSLHSRSKRIRSPRARQKIEKQAAASKRSQSSGSRRRIMKRSSWRYLWKSEDIRNKLLISLLLLAVYRLAANIPVPGVDRALAAQLSNVGGAAGNLVGLLDLLSGGAVSRFSVLAMGVYPYITAQIILQLLQPVIPALERMMKDDPREGRKWMEKWTMILTIPMALLSAFGQINIFNAQLQEALSDTGALAARSCCRRLRRSSPWWPAQCSVFGSAS